MTADGRTAERLALSVHGPAGVLDLVVPPGATAADVAREYAEQTGVPVADGAALPVLHRPQGVPLAADGPLTEAGIRTGELLVVTPPARQAGSPWSLGAGPTPGPSDPDRAPGLVGALWCAAAGAAAVLGGWCAAGLEPGGTRGVVLTLLAVGALLGVLPMGRFAPHRALVAPLVAGAGVFALVRDGGPERLPIAIGLAALAATVAAAVARALDERSEPGLRVWTVAGGGIFAVTGLATLADLRPEVSWGVLLLVATMTARFVPALAVAVPDQYLLDLDRLAATAWAPRDQTRRRGRTAVPPEAVERVAARGARIVTAAAAGVLGVVALSAPLLLATATVEIDRLGARVLVGLCGAALLLAARSHRHPGPRALLRLAGLAAWVALAAALLPDLSEGPGVALALGCVALAAVLVVVAVGTGRGWRSAWWSRCAEVAEGVTGAAAIGALLVAVGGFRGLWILTS